MKRAFLILVALAVIAGIGVAVTLYRRTSEPFKGYDGAEQFVTIEPGSGTRTIGQRLIEAGVIRNDVTFRASLWRSGRARSLQAGEFRFDRPMTPVEVVDKIARGDIYNRRITFPEGLNIREMARIYEQQGFGKGAAFMDAAKDANAIRDIDAAATDLEGYLFPETYSVPRDTTAAKLVGLMVGRFRQLFTSDMQRAAQALDLTPRQVVTLASLVEKETAQPSERPIVAAVYVNRLKIGMGMQADSDGDLRLQRARGDRRQSAPPRISRSIRVQHVSLRGPAAGPIASPGLASLQAAVAPAAVDYLYFVSRNDGSHVFARTLVEHNENVRQYQVLYFREQRARQKAGR